MLAVAMLAVGCGGLSHGKASPDAGCVPGVNASFAVEVHPILSERCARCHGASSTTSFALAGGAVSDLATVLGFADLDAPERSPFLLKATATGTAAARRSRRPPRAGPASVET